MSSTVELKRVEPAKERTDLISVLEWIFHENQIPPYYKVRLKAYTTVPHGQLPETRESWVELENLRRNIETFRHQIMCETNWQDWSTAISGVIVDEQLSPTMFIPMIDLEVIATGDPLKDLRDISDHILAIGQKGVFFQSGDIGLGGYFFVGKAVSTFESNYRKFISFLMTTLIDRQDKSGKARQNRLKSIQIGKKIILAKSDEEVNGVAEEILQAYPSLPGGSLRPGLEADPRWVAYALIGNRFFLRFTTGKGYESEPLLVTTLF